ncbi:MAG TPA: DUF3857 domain-containing protein [Phycisphaerae bacterium]|nr:DUF3857 domain-containing protein [Phycisphaerae bacterium]
MTEQNHQHPRRHLRWTTLGTLALLGATTYACADGPQFAVGRDEYPNANAVIIRWEQDWTLDSAGAVHRRDHQWVKLLNRRRIGSYADRTIDYRDGEDQVTVHVAQTHLPDGEVLPVPDYSLNLGAADEVAGWPAYAAWKQRIISFSGVQPDATLELDYEVITAAGVLPSMSAEVRLDAADPIHERIVRVSVPESAPLNFALTGAGDILPAVETHGGMATHTWHFRAVPAAPDETLAPRWRQGSPRLRFSTAASARDWASGWIDPVTSAAAPAGAAVTQFARDAVKNKLEPSARIEAVGQALAERFNFLDNHEAWRGRTCRPADAVFAANYGNPLEAAAVLDAALETLGYAATPVVAVDADAWSEQVPTDDAFAGVLLGVQTADGQLWLHPRLGIIHNPGAWGRHVLLDTSGADLQSTVINPRGEDDISRIDVAVNLDVSADGSATGRCSVQLTGMFVEPQELKSADQQKKLVRQVMGRILSGVTVDACSTTELSAQGFAATADLSISALPAQAGAHLLELGDGPVLLKDVHLPLAQRDRTAPLDLGGAIDERVVVRVTCPAAWQYRITPRPLQRISGDWGFVEQHVDRAEQSLSVSHEVRIAQAKLAADAYPQLRDAIGLLGATGYRQIAAASGAE